MKCNFLKCFTDPQFNKKIKRLKNIKNAAYNTMLNDPVKLFYHRYPNRKCDSTINGFKNNILIIKDNQLISGNDSVRFFRLNESKNFEFLGRKIKEVVLKNGNLVRKVSRIRPTENGFIEVVTKKYYSPLNKLLNKETAIIENIKNDIQLYVEKVLSREFTDYTKVK